MEEFLGNSSHLTICRDNISALNTFNKFVDLAYSVERKNWFNSCPIPCQLTVYEAKQRNFHKNAFFDFYDKQAFYFSVGYETFLIEANIETLVYDIGSFLAAVGGNLGLFLGFSCLSMLLGFVSMFKKFRKFK